MAVSLPNLGLNNGNRGASTRTSVILSTGKANETIIVRCHCGHCAEFPFGHLQRNHNLPSSTLIFDLQFKMRCKACKSAGPFRISLLDERFRGDPGGERIVVGAEAVVLKLVPDRKG